MADQAPVPSTIAGYTIMGARALRFGVFGTDYLGHNNDGLRLVKVLTEGEGLVIPEEAYVALKDDAQVLHFEAGAVLDQDQRVLTAHTVQAAAFGVLVGGSPLQNECVETTREFDPDQRVAGQLRALTLVQKVQLIRAIAQIVERLHKDGKSFPYLTPWNVILEAEQPKLVEVGLGYRPDNPKFDRTKIQEDVLVYLAPEVVKAIADSSVVQVSPAADVYALAATARSILLNKVADPVAGPPAQPGGAAPTRRELALKAGGIRRDAHQQYSRELEDLFSRCLSPVPASRPSAAAFAEALGQLVSGERLVWTPPPQWPKFAGIGAAVVVALLLVVFVVLPALQGPPDRVTSRQAYVAATRETDLAAREAKLREATMKDEQGNAQVIPEARRLLAVTRFVRWARSQKDDTAAPPPGPDAPGGKTAAPTPPAPAPAAEGSLDDVLNGLTKDGVGEAKDELAYTLRYVVAFLRRWEQGGPQRAAADKELEALAKDEQAKESLRALAAAARALTATGVERAPSKDELLKWLDAANDSSGEQGLLNGHPYQVHGDDYAADPDLADKPIGVKLESAWLGRLLAGRLQGLLGNRQDAQGKLTSARDVSTFATNAAYGLELAAHGTKAEDFVAARKALDVAQSKKGGAFAEGQLAIGQLELAEAHAIARAPDGQADAAKGYRKAAAAFEAASGTADTPGTDLPKQIAALAAEARFYEAVTVAMIPEAARDAEGLIARFIEGSASDAALTERFGIDAQLARGVVYARTGQAAKAQQDLLAAFKNGDPKQGLVELPELDPVPATRAEARAQLIKTIAESALAAVEALTDTPTKAQVEAAEKGLEALVALKDLPGAAEAVDKLRLLLAQGQLGLARARAFEGTVADRALEDARKAFAEALQLAPAATAAEDWLKALRGKLEVMLTAASRVSGNAEVERVLEPLRAARAELAEAKKNLPRGFPSRLWEQFEPVVSRRIGDALMVRIQGYVDERRSTWTTLDPMKPSYPGSDEQFKRDVDVLNEALAAAPEDPTNPQRIALAKLRYHAALLHRAKVLNPVMYDHATAGIELLERVDEGGSEVGDLRKNLHFLIGLVALKEGDSLRDKTREPRQLALDALARAAGCSNFADLRAKLRQNANVIPQGPPGREQTPTQLLAQDAVSRYDNDATIPRDPAFGTAVQNAQGIEAELSFATQIDRTNPNAFLLLARVLYSMGGADKADAAAERAQAAFSLARDSRDQAQLGVQVQAARLYCLSKFQKAKLTGEAAVSATLRAPDFRTMAVDGARAADQLFSRDQAAQTQRFNYGPHYWAARCALEDGQFLYRNNRKPEAKPKLEEAKKAYEDFSRIIAERDVPSEAAGWRGEYTTVSNLLRTYTTTPPR